MSVNELVKLRNIGTTVAKRLIEVGINNRSDLEKVGAAQAYQKIKRRNPDLTLPRCYYLYSLEGALRSEHWDDLPEHVKISLSAKVGLKK